MTFLVISDMKRLHNITFHKYVVHGASRFIAILSEYTNIFTDETILPDNIELRLIYNRALTRYGINNTVRANTQSQFNIARQYYKMV